MSNFVSSHLSGGYNKLAFSIISQNGICPWPRSFSGFFNPWQKARSKLITFYFRYEEYFSIDKCIPNLRGFFQIINGLLDATVIDRNTAGLFAECRRDAIRSLIR